MLASGGWLRLIWNKSGGNLRFIPGREWRQLYDGAAKMSEKFGATSTTGDVLSGVDLHGKRILVTGVSAGLGVETARALAARGANVIGAARNLEKAGEAVAEARREAATAGG